jgi:hypothetical protein
VGYTECVTCDTGKTQNPPFRQRLSTLNNQHGSASPETHYQNVVGTSPAWDGL